MPRLIGITFLGSSQLSIRLAQCCISFVREPISASIEIHGRAWHPNVVSELACVHQSIFERAEIDCRTEQVSDASAPKCPSTCGAWM